MFRCPSDIFVEIRGKHCFALLGRERADIEELAFPILPDTPLSFHRKEPTIKM